MGDHGISSCRGTTIDSTTILSTARFAFLRMSVSPVVIGVLASGEGGGREVSLDVGNGDS